MFTKFCFFQLSVQRILVTATAISDESGEWCCSGLVGNLGLCIWSSELNDLLDLSASPIVPCPNINSKEHMCTKFRDTNNQSNYRNVHKQNFFLTDGARVAPLHSTRMVKRRRKWMWEEGDVKQEDLYPGDVEVSGNGRHKNIWKLERSFFFWSESWKGLELWTQAFS